MRQVAGGHQSGGRESLAFALVNLLRLPDLYFYDGVSFCLRYPVTMYF